MTIDFESQVLKIGACDLIILPQSASAQLPSRGMVMAKSNINNLDVQIPLEPDGKGSHWLEVTPAMKTAFAAEVGDSVSLSIEVAKEWTPPPLPADLQDALAANPAANATWEKTTPKAQWDWIRWIRSTKSPATREKRIGVASSMLTEGKKRPCCFNRNQCTEPHLSKSGLLLEPENQ